MNLGENTHKPVDIIQKNTTKYIFLFAKNSYEKWSSASLLYIAHGKTSKKLKNIKKTLDFCIKWVYNTIKW